jgi:hypothetical protein
MLGAWRGPSSIVLYAPNEADARQLRKFKCANCELSLVVARQEGAPYPINLLRQLSVSTAATDVCLLIDADFFPSLSTYGSVRLTVPMPIPPRSVFVVPAFQNIAPKTNSVGSVSLEMLKQEWELKNVQVFHGNSASVSHAVAGVVLAHPSQFHRDTQTRKWIDAKEPYGISGLHPNYEPYVRAQAVAINLLLTFAQVIFNKTDPALPLFNTLLYNRGHNKVAFIHDLVKNGYTFTVLPKAWLTHIFEEHAFRLPFITAEDHQVAARANLTSIWLTGWQSA